MKLLRYCGVAVLALLGGLGSAIGPWSEGIAQECTVTLSPGQFIQSAIDAAQAGDVICLAAGEWQENLTITKSLTLRAAEVKPEPDAVIKSANKDWPVILIRSEKPIEVTIIGLKVTEAFGECYQEEPEWICAGGISVHGQAKATIQKNTIRGNWDVGIWMLGSSHATILNNTISGNREDGIVMWGSSQATILNNTISGNREDGIVMLGSSQATIQNNSISGNRDGIDMEDSSQATIQNNTISDNGSGFLGGAGIRMAGSSQATIENNKILNNGRYGVACFQQPCFNTYQEFEGAVRGSKNEISGNKKSDVCPKELEFLKTSTGGCYGPKC